jgi:hypothetical protein
LCLCHREFKGDVLACELLVHTAESFSFVFGGITVLGVEQHLEDSGSIDSISDTLTNDFSRIDEIFEPSLVNRGQSTAARALDAASLLWGRENTADTDDDHITAAEFLLKLANETLLHLVEGFKKAEGHLN